MFRFFAVLLRSTIAVFVGLLFAGGTLTLAADTVPVQRPTLVPVAPEKEITIVIPDVQGQPYVFAKSILQDHGLAWHVTGPVQGFAANTVSVQRPSPGTTVIDTGAPTVTLTLARNLRYSERGTPENDAPYAGTEIRIPAGERDRPITTVQPRLEPVPIPEAPLAPGSAPNTTQPLTPTTPSTPSTTPEPTQTPSTPSPTPTPTQPTQPTPTTNAPRPADFAVTGAPKEPRKSDPLPDRASALRTWIESHRQPTATNLNHWLYEHAYVVAGAKFGWWHGVEALQTLIEVDKRAEALWGVGDQSRTAAEKALAEVLARRS
jgi:hypothetical protein